MNSLSSRRARFGIVALAAVTPLAAGCGPKEATFAKVNGQTISQKEYIQALERAQISLPSPTGQPLQVPAGRQVMEQLITQKVVAAEASKLGVKPTDADIDRRYELQKKLVQQQVSGKTFEDAVKEQGLTPEAIKDQMRYDLTQTALLAKRMNVTEEELKKAYADRKSALGLPARVQLRVILAKAGSKEFQQAQKMLAAKTDFAEVATVNNQGQLKATGGLLPQAAPITELPAPWQAKVNQAKEGDYFGPVDAPGEAGTKAWVRVDKKIPKFELTYEDAKPLLMQQIVQERSFDPKNAEIGREIVRLKLDAKVETTDPKHQTMWQAVKDAAKASQAAAAPGASPPALTPLPTPGS